MFIENIKYYARQDSTFNLCDGDGDGDANEGDEKGELEQASQEMSRMKEENTLEKWMMKKEWERKQIGQSVCCFAEKI